MNTSAASFLDCKTVVEHPWQLQVNSSTKNTGKYLIIYLKVVGVWNYSSGHRYPNTPTVLTQ